MELNEIMAHRVSIRHYREGCQIERETLEELIGAALKAPSWKNFQTGRYYVVTSEDWMEKARAALPEFNRNSSTNAAALIVTTYVCGISGFREGEPENELGDAWGAYDLGLQNAFLLLKASELGLDSLVMGIRDGDQLREALEVPEDEEVVSVIAIGLRDRDPRPRPRKPVDEVTRYL